MRKGGTAIIVDAYVPWDSDALDLAAMHKKGKYGRPEVLQAVKSTYGVSEVRVSPIIIGARGIWSRKANRDIENDLCITVATKRRIVTQTIKWGIAIHRHHNRYIFATRRDRANIV